jgi:hypothetical protein
MHQQDVTLDEVLATFSLHISKEYPSAQDFRRNFNLLLKGKRERGGERGYAISLEKNIAFLNDLVADAEVFMETLLTTGLDESEGNDLNARLAALEKQAHGKTAQRHRSAFVDGNVPEFKEFFEQRKMPGGGYLEKLEFHYRYLMTLRIFLFEFISVLAAIRPRYSIPHVETATLRKIRGHIELTAHYYLGNVAVGEGNGSD